MTIKKNSPLKKKRQQILAAHAEKKKPAVPIKFLNSQNKKLIYQ